MEVARGGHPPRCPLAELAIRLENGTLSEVPSGRRGGRPPRGLELFL